MNTTGLLLTLDPIVVAYQEVGSPCGDPLGIEYNTRTQRFSDVVSERGMDAALALPETQRLLANLGGIAEPDHAVCEHDGCDVVLCYCGNPDVCDGTEQPQCGHHSFLCSAHAHVDCDDCAVDAAVERDLAYAREMGGVAGADGGEGA